MIPAHAEEKWTRVAVCKCGEMVTHYGSLEEIVFKLVRLGWKYENRLWQCAKCAGRESREAR